MVQALSSKRSDTTGSASEWFANADELRYQAYSYSYPHKTAYRTFDQSMSIKQIWAEEKRDALFLYMHIPFCEMRCGFCNLFTTSNPDSSFELKYLDALERQAEWVSLELGGDASFARMALGGGTPTYLEANDLKRLFRIAKDYYGVDPHAVPVSVETSPYTSTVERLAVLKEVGVERVSIGIQSFIEQEVMAVGRSQSAQIVERSLGDISSFNFDILNIDLMYGLPGQTPESWAFSLMKAISYDPEQIYLYPLYVRPLTGLGRKGTAHTDIRVELYRQACEILMNAGYRQISMRMFERTSESKSSRPEYCCQRDGMIGLGCGARSYTSSIHYSMRYAVGQKPIREILQKFVDEPNESFAHADYGYILSLEEQKRRFVIQSLLQIEGLVFADYERTFDTPVHDDFDDQLQHLIVQGLAQRSTTSLVLTPLGLEWSDRIGHEFYSPNVLKLMAEYEES